MSHEMGGFLFQGFRCKNDNPGSAKGRLDPEMKRGSKLCCEVQKCLPACFPLSVTCFCISLQHALPGKEAEAAKPRLSRDFCSYRNGERRRFLWKKLHTGILGTLGWALVGRKRGTSPLGGDQQMSPVPCRLSRR